MSGGNASRLAWSLCTLALVLLGLTVLIAVLGWSTPLPRSWFFSWREQIVSAIGIAGVPILGGLIASRRPRDPYGWLWLGLGLGLALSGFAVCYAAYALVAEPGSLPFTRTVGTLLAGIGWTAWLILSPLVLLLFPTGRPPSRRWRFLVWTVVSVGGASVVIGPFIPGESGFAPVENPLGVGGAVGDAISVADEVAVLGIFGCNLLAALSLVFRFRRAGGVERQQIKWFAYASVLYGAYLVYGGFLGQDLPGIWDAVLAISNLALLYAAVGLAILRHRLYDIDRIINKTLVYGSLTASLALVYLGGVVSLQYAFRTLAGGNSQLVIVASTLTIAALFYPLRRRIQNFVDRRFYRNKYDARETLAAFGSKLRDETDLDGLGGDLVGAVRETMQPEHVGLWLRESERGHGSDG